MPTIYLYYFTLIVSTKSLLIMSAYPILKKHLFGGNIKISILSYSMGYGIRIHKGSPKIYTCRISMVVANFQLSSEALCEDS